MLKLVRAKKDFVPDSPATEIILLPFSIKDAKALGARVTGTWENALAEQAGRKWKAAAKDWTETDAVRAIEVSRSDGGSIVWAMLNPASDAFALHSGLRTGLSPAIKAALATPETGLYVSLAALSVTQQKFALDAFAFLATTLPWKATMYGKKSQEPGKSAPKKVETPELSITILHGLAPAAAEKIASQSAALGRANDLVRTLAELPSNHLHSRNYRDRVEARARELKLGYKFWDVDALKKEGAGAFLAVVSADPKAAAGIAQVSYKPTGNSNAAKKNLVLVGKGLCFDTGGYNVKVGDYMLGMHADMTGSAVALGLVQYFAETKAPFAVTAYLAIAENLISPTAYRPNDVVVAANGTSIEVVDTDAEGRMVLSDTLAIASREKPALLLDFATLTGAAVRALDTARSAVFCNSNKLMQAAHTAGEESGERVWNFPMGEDYQANLKSRIADIRQCSTTNAADHIYAATFLSHFVEKGVAWAHLDLASCEHKGGLGLLESDTTGFGLRWARALVERWF